MIVHVLAYLSRLLREGPADWRRNAEHVVAGVRSRRALLGGAFLAGVIVALATYPAQQAWLGHRHEHRHLPVSDSSGLNHFDAASSVALISRPTERDELLPVVDGSKRDVVEVVEN